MKTITFSNRTHYVIVLDLLTEHPTAQTRKLLNQLFTNPVDNEQAIQQLQDWLTENITDAKANREIAASRYDEGHKKVDSRSRRPEIIEQRKVNRRLVELLHHAERRLRELKKLQSIFQEFMN